MSHEYEHTFLVGPSQKLLPDQIVRQVARFGLVDIGFQKPTTFSTNLINALSDMGAFNRSFTYQKQHSLTSPPPPEQTTTSNMEYPSPKSLILIPSCDHLENLIKRITPSGRTIDVEVAESGLIHFTKSSDPIVTTYCSDPLGPGIKIKKL